MADLVMHVLATYALWFVVTQSDLPLWGSLRSRWQLRSTTFSHFTGCAVCSGFWCSLALVLLRLVVVSVPLLRPTLGYGVVLCLGGAAGCYLIETSVRRLEAR